MVADGLTKALGPERHRKLAKMMGMGVWQKSEDYTLMKIHERKEEEGEVDGRENEGNGKISRRQEQVVQEVERGGI
jgi:hypothetical protein